MTTRTTAALTLLGIVCLAAAAAQERPLPDLAPFLAEVRTRLQTDSALQGRYTYVETRREASLDRGGRVTSESVKRFEHGPGLPGEPRWERLIEENGRPVGAATLEEQDRERQRRAEAMARRSARDPQREYERQVRAWEEYQREAAARVADIFRVYDIAMAGREVIGGHDTIAFSLTPRRNAETQTREGGQMRRFIVRAWISETDFELVRLQATAVEDVAIAWGLLARLHKGARLIFERRKVNGEAWLPASSSYEGSARVGLFAVVRRRGSSEYSDYRVFTVDTSTTFGATD
jgi:hypothetical protein